MLNKENNSPNNLKLYFKKLCFRSFGWMCVLTSIYLLFCVLSYTQLDSSFNTSSSFSIHNFGGIFGSYLANLLLSFLGLESLFLIYEISLIGKHFIFPEKMTINKQTTILYFIVSIIPTCLCLSYLSVSLPTSSGMGGFLGLSIKTYIGEILTNIHAEYIHILIFISAFIFSLITLYVALNITPKTIIRIELTTRFCFAKLKSFIIYLFKKKSKPITVKPQKSKILNIAKKVLPPQEKKKTATKPTSQNTTKPTHIKKYIFPSIELLNKPKPEQPSNSNDASNKEKAIMLENILQEFKLTGKITGIKTGPVITLFEMLPGKSIKISDIKNLNEDIARKIKAIASTRIAVIPGTDKIGIELPNLHRQTVSLRTQFESNEFKNTTYKLPLSLGCDTMGNPIFVDLAKTPHLLVAGATGMGKSVGVNSMILSLLYKKHPDECKFIMIDPKAVEFSTYKDIPHLLTPIVTDVEKSVAALNWAIREMENRYSNMASIEVKDIESYNQKVKTMKGQFITRQKTTGFDPHTGAPITEDEKIELKPIPYIVIVVDEFADLMQSKEHKKEVETNISRLAAKARAAGIHLILTTQRPSVDVVTGLIKSNFPSRISYSVASGQDSRTIIDECGAERLLGKGDGLYKGNGNNSLVRIHAAFVTENEICNVTKFIKEQGKPNYIENEAIQKIQNQNTLATLDKSIIKKQRKEDLYAQAVEIVLTTGKTSISYLQRQLGIGFNPAASLMEQLEANGIVSAPDATNKRVILKKGI